MKNTVLFFSLLFFLSIQGIAQPFTKLGIGRIVAASADSRSVNIIDVNNDGWEDIFISNGLNGGENNTLYINEGRDSFNPFFTFDSENPINKDGSASVGATFADWDNDGDIDAYVTNWYGTVNQWYRNDGSGRFEQVNFFSNLETFSETAAWADYDGDSYVDLYVTNSEGNKANLLFRNLGNGDFSRITGKDVVSDLDLSRNATWADYDGDGDIDLYVSNENNDSNDLFRNNGNGELERVFSSGIASSGKSTMSNSWGDIDNDGDLDLVVANAGFYLQQSNLLYRNDGDVFTPLPLSPVSTDKGCSYGSNFADYDNDGDLDLIVLNGFCNNNLQNFLYENQGDGTFIKATDALPGLQTVCSYGGAWGDLNNDGFMDLVIANCKNRPDDPSPKNEIFLGQPNDNHWLKVKLEGTTSNRSAIGAKVRAKAVINGEVVWQMREISAQSGYCGQNSLIAHVGLADATKVDSLKVEWPSGNITWFTNVSVDQQLTIIEGISTSRPNPNLQKGFKMDVYPNPTQEKLRINISTDQSRAAKNMVLRLVDNLGKLIWKEEMSLVGNELNYELDTANATISTGIYMLHASTGRDNVSKKVEIR